MQNNAGSKIQEFQLQKELLLLLPEKAIYWKRKKSLLLADLHIGKITHFRKNNIALPSKAADSNFIRLEQLLIKWSPRQVYFLGDLFHSSYNEEWDRLTFLLAKYRKTKFFLISGNHDILNEDHYIQAGVDYLPEIVEKPFYLTHHPTDHLQYYNLCGHIHPGIKLKGVARQSMKLPCFYFGKNRGILPAFGTFTGSSKLKISEGENIFAILDDQLLHLNTEKNG